MTERAHSTEQTLVVRDGEGRVVSARGDVWGRWLAQPDRTTFRVECGSAGFTARLELRRGQPYWYAYGRRGGRLRKAYLGRAADLTPERLAAALRRLGETDATPPAPPAHDPSTPAQATLLKRHHNLPAALSSFVGRRAELAELRGALSDTRLLTLTGTGGVGKTRLALRLAGDLSEDTFDSVWLVEFAPLTEPALLPQMVAQALGIPDQAGRPAQEALVTALAAERALLLLDNCEHLLDACAGLAGHLLHACPGLRIVATSREPLGVPGEVVWRVPSLAAPEGTREVGRVGELADSQPPIVASLRGFAAIDLFVERAQAARPGFALTAANAAAVVDVCRRLDGIPLAIELAAARTRMLSPEELAARLDDRFRLLVGGSRAAPPRQQTLRATVDWSYALLDDEERRLFERLSIFAGGFSLEAAEAVCGGEGIEAGQVVALLAGLVDRSLVVSEPEGGPGGTRYRLLETLRAYAAARLTERGEGERLREQHARWLTDRAEEAERAFKGPAQGRWLRWAEREHDNVRAVLAWAVERQESGLAVRLAAALSWSWLVHQRWREGLDWAMQVLSLPHAGPTRERGLLLIEVSQFALFGGGAAAGQPAPDPAVITGWARECLVIGEALSDEALVLAACVHAARLRHFGLESEGMPEVTPAELSKLARRLGDRWAERRLLQDASLRAMRAGDLDTAAERLAEAVDLARKAGDGFSLAMVLGNLGDVERARDAHPRAGALYAESLVLFDTLGLAPPPGLVHNLGWVALAAGDRPEAAARFTEALARFRRLGDRRGMAECVIGLGAVAAAGGAVSVAARRFGAGEAALEALGMPLSISNHADCARWLAVARSGRGRKSFAQGQAEGRTLPLDQAVAEALAESEIGGSARDEAGRPRESLSRLDALTGRERDVARLAAQGLTNRQIAAALTIAEKTAANHLDRVFAKLDLRSRIQLAAAAHRLGLTPAQ